MLIFDFQRNAQIYAENDIQPIRNVVNKIFN